MEQKRDEFEDYQNHFGFWNHYFYSILG